MGWSVHHSIPGLVPARTGTSVEQHTAQMWWLRCTNSCSTVRVSRSSFGAGFCAVSHAVGLQHHGGFQLSYPYDPPLVEANDKNRFLVLLGGYFELLLEGCGGEVVIIYMNTDISIFLHYHSKHERIYKEDVPFINDVFKIESI